MGNWNINIQGTGCHHNGNTMIDADLLGEEFVKRLKTAGQSIEHATFTSGGKVNLLVTDAAPIEITVNGETRLVPKRSVTYGAVLEMAGYKPDRIISVMYYDGPSGGKPEGILNRGQEVAICDGMKFAAHDTSNA